MNKLPIIVLNWNGLEDTKECIESLLSQSYSSYHIYLVDNHSDNLEGQSLASLYQDNDQISVILNAENLGFTKAHIQIYKDIIVQLSDAKFLCLLNNDTFADPNWLHELTKAAEENDADIVSSKMIQYFNRDKMDNAGHKMLNTGEIIPIGHGEATNKYKDSFENMGACAGACLYRMDMLKQIGFFDPHFSTGYEDAELGLRAIVAGYKAVYCPKAIVYHKMGQSIKKIFDESYSLMIQNSILYSYFKLVPTFNIIIAIPSFIFKYASMFVIDILFFRIKYLKIIVKSLNNLWSNRHYIRNSRTKFYNSTKEPILTFDLSRKLEFFFLFDVKRFWSQIILRKKNSFDQYGAS